MGRYNPHLPRILGQEWAPIREQPLSLTPAVNLIEVGHSFNLDTSRTLQTSRFYVNEYPPGDPGGQVILTAIYRRGTEALTGPIQSVTIPVSLGTVSGGTVTINNANTIAQALANPSDIAYVSVDVGETPFIILRFETESYMPLLMGKRILGLTFRYVASLSTRMQNGAVIATVGSTGSTLIDVGSIVSSLNPTSFFNDFVAGNVIGEVDYHWNAPITNIIEALPWSPNRLRGFDDSSSVTDRSVRIVMFDVPDSTDFVEFHYGALEVFYCEEQRIAWGGKRLVGGRGTYILGQNFQTIRDLSDATNPVLPAGEYSLIMSSANLTPGNSTPYPGLNQIQQLYTIPTHQPVRIVRPFPIDATAVGKTFTTELTQLLPQLSLHASGGSALTEVHVYGRQAVAQVYGNITATQEIYDVPANGAASYPWVRYYARRFGNSTVPLKLSSTSPTVSGSSVEVTPMEFDELDEIVDGWKEVTLRFDTPPSMGAGSVPQWQWSATGELPGSRWEVLGAVAPALSGAPGNLLLQAPGNNQLSIATYGMPVSGANVNLGWVPQYAPPVSATVDDQTSDAMLIFSQDMPAVTGFSAELAEQELTGIGLDCGLDPCCIPTALDYVEITWDLPVNTGVGQDTFTRTEAGTWGTPDVGPAYDYSGVVSDFSVNGDKGVVTFSFAGGSNFATLALGAVNFDITTEIAFETSPATNYVAGGIVGRFTSSSDMFMAQVRFNSTGTLTLSVSTFTGGVETILGSYSPGNILLAIGSMVHLRFMVYGSFLKAKVWEAYTDEPATWGVEVTSTANASSGNVGLIAVNTTAVIGHVIEFDNLTIGPADYYFGHYELQRMDTVSTDWQTIMKATSPATTGFNDYEARVGIVSSYRIRAVDVYDFPGPWSSTVTATVPEPGVTIGCEGGHLLIFTSNERQDGSINLAYSSVWEDQVEEGFVFPEARFVELQAMYNRDYFIAFRPSERGGEQFSRTVLVQAAAISPETLADFTSLRDMAWADVPYICVRDEDGNRWFATILVPGGRVVHNRSIYMAPVEVIEVTDTPSEVDP